MKIFENKSFGNYVTQDYLGCGSFSAVYTAYHKFTKEKVALKIAHTNDNHIIDEFSKIVKTGLKGLLKIDHKSIIGIKEYFTHTEDGVEYFIMVLELVKGNSLDRTNVVEALSVPEKLKMFLTICDAISYAHEFEYIDQNDYHSLRIKGLFHGDIKPNNIMVTADFEPSIIDFSFLNLKKAQEENETKFGNKEVNTGAFGTKGYMAPEQEHHGIINEKTDIYSLGVVLKQLIYGFKYEYHPAPDGMIDKINVIIAKACHENPAERHASVKELQHEINAVLHPPMRISKKWMYVAAACILALIIGLSFLFTGNSGDKNREMISQETPAERGAKAIDTAKQEVDISKNKYYALLIGNNDYQHWKKLEYPINDVNNMKKTLLENYTFEPENITTIENGTYEKIYKGFESFTDKGPNTYLLIYYAGHGKYDQVTDKAALIPVDAEENSDSKNITSDIIRDLLKKCKIHNILFISDACYLGAMASRGETKDSVVKKDIASFKSFASKQSRKFISSGAKETVPDKSYFNEYLIKYLKNNEQDITFEYTLYNDIIEPIRQNSLTTPVFGVFFDTRDEGGHFFFVKRKK